ncbi:hypothetical protein I6G21_06970 [Rothia kristinae]|uniref:YCII-related domain-containing protein n=1 Tax=Rothia kristinae TaxID=37923 RepID=A0A7T3CIB9_9MICC|nr:hypothetical protein [Amycolatopsis sp. H6(2020)]MBG7588044.1 hypothetical protein [Rothia kristinae]QPT54709.1 hypothetical protein I6G21_06970 [Rothia kristinae]
MTVSEHFAVLYSYGPAEAQAAHRPAHRRFLAGLLDEGKLLVSGPFTDGSDQALLILRAESEEEVAQLLDEDPMRTGGVVTERRIHRWNPVLGTVGAPEAPTS